MKKKWYYEHLCGHTFSFLLYMYLGEGLVIQMVTFSLTY